MFNASLQQREQLGAHAGGAGEPPCRAPRSGRSRTTWAGRVGAFTSMALAVVAAAVLVAGCGSSDSGGSSSSKLASTNAAAAPASDGGGSPDVKAAKAAVAKYSAVQPPLDIKPLGTAPAKHKKLAVMTCAPAACVGAISGAQDAAKALGWSVKSFTNPFTPEGYQAAWNQIIQSRPDGVVYIGVLPNELIKHQLAVLKQMKVPLMGISAAAHSLSKDGPIRGVFANEPNFGLSGTLMGDIILSDHQGAPGKAVLLFDKTQEANLGIVKTNFKQTLQKAGWNVDLLQVTYAQEGKGIPGQVVSYLQRNPKVEYVAVQASEYSTGVPEAIKAAGLPQKVRVITRVPDAANVKEISNGTMFAAVGEEDKTLGWRGADGLVRLFAGKSSFDPEPVGWHQIVTKDNVGSFKLDSLGSPAVPGDPENFLKAWGVH